MVCPIFHTFKPPFHTLNAVSFGDEEVRYDILTTAEAAGHTIEMGDKRHYLLANVALVGEAIMLAMRTHTTNR